MVQMSKKFETPQKFQLLGWLSGAWLDDFRHPHLKSLSGQRGCPVLVTGPLNRSIGVPGLVSVCVEIMVALGF